MERRPRYFPLSLDSLRAIAAWSADCADRALPVFEARAGSDPRPRAAIEGTRVFARGGERVAQLRSLAMAAHAAARAQADPGAAAYAALALELGRGGERAIGDAMVRWALEHAPAEAREVLGHMPPRADGRSRLERLCFGLDSGLRIGAGPHPPA